VARHSRIVTLPHVGADCTPGPRSPRQSGDVSVRRHSSAGNPTHNRQHAGPKVSRHKYVGRARCRRTAGLAIST
jgi:hypothetical protein